MNSFFSSVSGFSVSEACIVLPAESCIFWTMLLSNFSTQSSNMPAKRERALPHDAQPATQTRSSTPIQSASVTQQKVSAPPQGSSALLVVGTYHSVMAGLVVRPNKLLLKFSVKHHVGCVSRIAVCEKYLVSAGTDERLFLFTVKDRGGQVADLGSLAPASEVTTLVFQGTQFLVCGCHDGTIAVYRTRDWESALAVQVHDKAVVDLKLHPTGKPLAVSVGLDRQVVLLDMSSGKLIARSKLSNGITPIQILFSPTGAHFVVVHMYGIVVFDVRTCSVVASASVEKQPANEIHCAVFVGPSSIVFGSEDGSLTFLSDVMQNTDASATTSVLPKLTLSGVPAEILESQAQIKDETKHKYPTRHATRVKALLYRRDASLVSADANGCVIVQKLLHADTVASGTASATAAYLSSANCQGRITHMDLLER